MMADDLSQEARSASGGVSAPGWIRKVQGGGHDGRMEEVPDPRDTRLGNWTDARLRHSCNGHALKGEPGGESGPLARKKGRRVPTRGRAYGLRPDGAGPGVTSFGRRR